MVHLTSEGGELLIERGGFLLGVVRINYLRRISRDLKASNNSLLMAYRTVEHLHRSLNRCEQGDQSMPGEV